MPPDSRPPTAKSQSDSSTSAGGADRRVHIAWLERPQRRLPLLIGFAVAYAVWLLLLAAISAWILIGD